MGESIAELADRLESQGQRRFASGEFWIISTTDTANEKYSLATHFPIADREIEMVQTFKNKRVHRRGEDGVDAAQPYHFEREIVFKKFGKLVKFVEQILIWPAKGSPIHPYIFSIIRYFQPIPLTVADGYRLYFAEQRGCQ